MKRILLAALATCAIFVSIPAYACDNDRYPCLSSSQKHQVAQRHQAKRYTVAHRRVRKGGSPRIEDKPTKFGGLITVQTPIGKAITVSVAIKDRMLDLIADLRDHGYVPNHISCYASGGHVSHSRHYSGNACDFDGSLSVAPFLRTALADELIKKHGLHNGCDYVLHGVRDCGHIDDVVGFAHRSYPRAYARYSPHRTHYRRYARR